MLRKKLEEKENIIKNKKFVEIIHNFKPISKKYKKSKKLIGLTTSLLHGIKNNKKVSKEDKNRKMKIYNDRLIILKKIMAKWIKLREENNKLLKLESKNKKS